VGYLFKCSLTLHPLAILLFMLMFLPNLRSACKHSKPMGEQSCGVRCAEAQ
jgi:hypothetical protein